MPDRSQNPALSRSYELHRFNLPVFELDGSRAAEDFNEDIHLAARLIDRVHRPLEALERPFLDFDAIAGGKIDLDLGLRDVFFGGLEAQHSLNFMILHGDRLARRPGEVSHSARLPNE